MEGVHCNINRAKFVFHVPRQSRLKGTATYTVYFNFCCFRVSRRVCCLVPILYVGLLTTFLTALALVTVQPLPLCLRKTVFCFSLIMGLLVKMLDLCRLMSMNNLPCTHAPHITSANKTVHCRDEGKRERV